MSQICILSPLSPLIGKGTSRMDCYSARAGLQVPLRAAEVNTAVDVGLGNPCCVNLCSPCKKKTKGKGVEPSKSAVSFRGSLPSMEKSQAAFVASHSKYCIEILFEDHHQNMTHNPPMHDSYYAMFILLLIDIYRIPCVLRPAHMAHMHTA